MAKLYFRFGTMGSAKTLNLLAVAHNYESQSKPVFLIKPQIDNRFGESIVKSRAGLHREADLIVNDETDLLVALPNNTACVLVDEAQFLSAPLVEQLRKVATYKDVPVICYGLRTNFKSKLFEGSQRLLELADSVEEIKTTCAFCHKKAIMNLQIASTAPVSDGVEIGAEDKYRPACFRCYLQRSKHFLSASETFALASNTTD
ncbi:MAG: thymidine kinase [Legionellales bacterium]|nr:thymidine kinase [Legionellales bacterium]|tara:strand:+ start:13 stop:621 length:609 start_codon:yes stop_codon:yes gene_type:complete